MNVTLKLREHRLLPVLHVYHRWAFTSPKLHFLLKATGEYMFSNAFKEFGAWSVKNNGANKQRDYMENCQSCTMRGPE